MNTPKLQLAVVTSRTSSYPNLKNPMIKTMTTNFQHVDMNRNSANEGGDSYTLNWKVETHKRTKDAIRRNEAWLIEALV